MENIALHILLEILVGIVAIFSTVISAAIIWSGKATMKNTTELAVLNSKIETIVADTKDIPKLKQDVNALHDWRRNIEGES